jgi:hypothetical protein
MRDKSKLNEAQSRKEIITVSAVSTCLFTQGIEIYSYDRITLDYTPCKASAGPKNDIVHRALYRRAWPELYSAGHAILIMLKIAELTACNICMYSHIYY